MISVVDYKSTFLPPIGVKGIAKVARGWFLGCDLSLDYRGGREDNEQCRDTVHWRETLSGVYKLKFWTWTAADGNLLNCTLRDALTIIENNSKVRTSRNKPVVSKGPTTKELTNTVLKETRIIVLETKWDHPVFLLRIPLGLGLLPSNTIAKPRGDLKVITTRSGISYDGSTIPPTSSPMLKEVERETEATKDKGPTTKELTNTVLKETRIIVLETKWDHPVFLLRIPLGLGLLPSNTIAKPRGDLKVITTRSGISYDGSTIPPTSSPMLKEVERETEATKDKPNPKPLIPYPLKLNDQKLREKANNQMLKFLQIFQKLHFDISFADALLHIPKFASTFKSLLSNKEKLFELASTLLNENCLAVLLKNLPKRLRDPGKFHIPCDFPELEECLALADLGASINLMPLFVWKKLSLPELTPTRMTLELANQSVTYLVGVAEDVFMKVRKFYFPADFVAVDGHLSCGRNDH
nr:reverse transcriptase domain-containing protein [Tanacetum cinerariifolium]